MTHKVSIVDKKTKEMKVFYISNVSHYIDYIKELFGAGLFYVEIEPEVSLLSLNEYKEIIRSCPDTEDIIFPEKIKTAEELDYWIQSWKILEEVYSLSLMAE